MQHSGPTSGRAIEQSDHLLIQGDFLPPGRERVLKALMRVSAILLAVGIVVSMITYGLRVHFESDINKVAKETREINEKNKELQVKLNHIRSYRNVEMAASRVPHLRMPEIVLNVAASRHSAKMSLSSPPHTVREFPRAYGY
jgi:hypothetical protein